MATATVGPTLGFVSLETVSVAIDGGKRPLEVVRVADGRYLATKRGLGMFLRVSAPTLEKYSEAHGIAWEAAGQPGQRPVPVLDVNKIKPLAEAIKASFGKKIRSQPKYDSFHELVVNDRIYRVPVVIRGGKAMFTVQSLADAMRLEYHVLYQRLYRADCLEGPKNRILAGHGGSEVCGWEVDRLPSFIGVALAAGRRSPEQSPCVTQQCKNATGATDQPLAA